MKRNAEDRIGQRFGRLVIESVERRRGGNGRLYPTATCTCDCGGRRDVRVENLVAGGTSSCGCAQREATVQRCLTHGGSRRGQVTREYRIWSQMLARCGNPKHVGFADYGGRGIRVCDRWKSFASFIADMGPAPSVKHTVERRDTNGGYEPGNCEWILGRLQGKNTRRVRRITFAGMTLILTDWAVRLGVGPGVLSRRVAKLGEHEALTELAAEGGLRWTGGPPAG